MKTTRRSQKQENTDKQVVFRADKAKGRQAFVMPIELAESFGKLGMTHKDIADFLFVTEKTIWREFNRKNSEFKKRYNKGRAVTAQSLRMKLLTRAVKDDRDQLLIFALKNFCGMSDKVDVENTGEVTINILHEGKAMKEPEWLKN